MVSTTKVKERQDLHWTALDNHNKNKKSVINIKVQQTESDRNWDYFCFLIFDYNKIPTWSYSGVLQGLLLVPALSGWLELRGKLRPCGGEGLVHISGYSVENVSNPPKKDRKETTKVRSHISTKTFLNTALQKGDSCSWCYFGTSFTPSTSCYGDRCNRHLLTSLSGNSKTTL